MGYFGLCMAAASLVWFVVSPWGFWASIALGAPTGLVVGTIIILLTNRERRREITVEDAEQRFILPRIGQLSENGDGDTADNATSASSSAGESQDPFLIEWQHLKQRIKPVDRLVHFRTGWWTWYRLFGREGIAVLRGDEEVGHVILKLN